MISMDSVQMGNTQRLFTIDNVRSQLIYVNDLFFELTDFTDDAWEVYQPRLTSSMWNPEYYFHIKFRFETIMSVCPSVNQCYFS